MKKKKINKEKVKKEKKPISRKTIIILSIVGVVLILALCALLVWKVYFSEKDYEVGVIEVVEVLQSNDSSDAAKQTIKNVVQIINEVEDKKIYGTGFFDESGYLVTNSHVVDIKGDISVLFNNGSLSKAKIYSNDIVSDIALLTVEDVNCKALPFGSTMQLEVTDEVYSVGHQLKIGGDASVTKGIVSAKRSASGIEFIQTDAAVNSGGSGGPVINSKGEVLGMVTLARDNATLSFAISSDTLDLYIDRLINNKKVTYIEEARETNALGVVLKEVNYTEEDIYGEKDFLKKDKKEEKEESKNENKGEHVYTDQPVVSNKSSDNKLKSLSVEGYNIAFSPDNLLYQITVGSTVKSVNVNAVANHPNTKVTVSGNTGFKYGTNKVYINTVSESGTRRRYTIDVIVPETRLDRATRIIVGLDTMYSSSHGQNVFNLSWDYADSDGVRVYGSTSLDMLSKIYVDVYSGWSEHDNGVTSDGKQMRLLKSYTFTPTVNQTSVYIPLSEIRAVLTDDEYEGGVYEGADLTFKLRLVTKEQGTFSGRTPWGLSK